MKKIVFATGNSSKGKRFSKELTKYDIRVIKRFEFNPRCIRKWKRCNIKCTY